MVLSFAALLAGCVLRTPIVKAPGPAPVSLSTVHDHYEDRSVSALPEALVARLQELLAERGLQPSVVSEQGFATHRSTANRLDLLPDDELVLLVEAEAEYISQLNGRMRWQVEATLSLDPPDAEPISSELSVTVFLLFMHQDADDAILDAAPVIERHVGYMLDEYFTSLQP